MHHLRSIGVQHATTAELVRSMNRGLLVAGCMNMLYEAHHQDVPCDFDVIAACAHLSWSRSQPVTDLQSEHQPGFCHRNILSSPELQISYCEMKVDSASSSYDVVHLRVDYVELVQARTADIQSRKKNLDSEVQHQEDDAGQMYRPLYVRPAMRDDDIETWWKMKMSTYRKEES